MKLNFDILKYLTKDEWRVLTAIEMGLRNHEYVPMPLIESIANLKRANCYKLVKNLLKYKLLLHKSKPYDGYTLSFFGYDFLAIKVFLKRGNLKGISAQMGVGKESDIYLAFGQNNDPLVLKLTHLGKQSFRTIQQKRDYLQHRTSWNWLYLSRLSATKEFVYLQTLYKLGIPTPVPIDYNRHAILMSYVDGKPLNQIKEIPNPKAIYETLMEILCKFVELGIIHGDYNEFNLLLDNKGKISVIDFPQVISVNHPDAEMQFDRDVNCIQNFFARRYQIHFEDKPKLGVDVVAKSDLTKDVAFAGYIKELLGERANDIQLLEVYHKERSDSPEEEKEEESMKDVQWNAEDEEEKSEEESDKNIAEERLPITQEELQTEVKAEEPVKAPEEDKTMMSIATIKAKIKKELHNTSKREKLKRVKNKVKKKSKEKNGEQVYRDELFD